MTLTRAKSLTGGGLCSVSKMPCSTYNLPPLASCPTGRSLASKPNSVCSHCYARKGRALWSKDVKTGRKRRLWSVNHATATDGYNHHWTSAMAKLILHYSPSYFRWHSSGDLLNVKHLELIVQVCRLTPNTRHWLPTRERSTLQQYLSTHGALPSNLTLRIAADYVNDCSESFYSTDPQITYCTVSTRLLPLPDSPHPCPATWLGTRNPATHTCDYYDCRACWSTAAAHTVIDYKLH